MLNKPKFLSPSTNQPDCVVNANDEYIYFSCLVDGNEAINRYILNIYDLETNDCVLIQDSNDFENGVPERAMFDENGLFFPVNNKNQNNILVIPTTGRDTDGNALFPNRLEAYYWNITVIGTSGVMVSSADEAFYANTPPEVSILYKHTNIDYSPLLADSIISDKTCSFKGDYIQEEGVGLKRYGWRLTNSQDNRVIIDTISNNNIYGIKENILCSYNGFLDDSQYSIELYVETQNGYCVTTESIDFSVEYETSYVTSDFRVECLPDEPSIMLNWQNTVAIQGRVEGAVNYINNFPIIGNSESRSVEIPQGTSVIWDYGASSSLDIPEDCYVVLSTQISSIKNTILFYAEGVDDNGYKIMRKLSFEVIDQGTKGRFVYDVLSGDGNLFTKYYTPEDNYQPSDYTWYIITMAPATTGDLALQVVPSIAINGLYPNSTSYPNADTYPRYGVWDKLNSSEGGEV